MLEFEFKGKTIKDAIDSGLAKLGCNREDVVVRIVNEGSTGLFGLMGAKPAVVLISVEKSKCNVQTADDRSIKIDRNKICEKAKTFLSEILKK
jgi:predicted RNA-binding protein Jag